MISEREFEHRLEQVRQNRELEPAFFRCLLDAVVYVHAPVSDDHPRLRLVQFRHPDGFDAIPFFTSLEKARVPAGITAKIVPLRGRQFLELTQGATVMLNPNDGGCVLYPEEVSALLQGGTVARVEKLAFEVETPFLVMEEANAPVWLLVTLKALYEGLAFVDVAYALRVATPEHPDHPTYLIVIGVAPEHAERAARATITQVQSAVAEAELPLDLTVFDPAHGLPEYLSREGVERIFDPRSQP